MAMFGLNNAINKINKINKQPYDLKLHVLMLGGRRCGKTSVLAAMQGCFDQVFARETNLTISTSNLTTLDAMEKKRQEIENYFHESKYNFGFVADNSPTAEDSTYSFDIRCKGKDGKKKDKEKNSKIQVEFYDFPGEWLINEHIEWVERKINESDVIMITIDTPHMMEEDGVYHDNRNCCYRITELMKKNLNSEEDNPKLILFIPLKCEKYRDNMDVVAEQVRKSYKNLIDFLNKNYCEIAITPIFTMGTAAFDRFLREQGVIKTIKIDKNREIPEKSLYYFTKDAYQGNNTRPQASPKYCEQPLVYTLLYALTLVTHMKQKRLPQVRKFNPVLDKFRNFASVSDYLDSKKGMYKNIELYNKDGYFLISDPMKFIEGKKD